ncbi:MAG: ABC transporter permease [Promethearchaeota archaeon]
MRIMDKKVFREIVSNKGRSLIIVLAVSITLSLMISMRGGYPMLIDSYTENMIYQNVADGRFTFTSPVSQILIDQMQNNKTFLENNHINNLESRIFFKTDITYKGNQFPAIIIGVDYPNKVNKLVFHEISPGINISTNFLNGTHNCIMELRFAGVIGQKMSLGDNVSINFNSKKVEVTMKAVAQDTDFLYVVDPASHMTLLGQMAVIWVDINLVQDTLFAGANVVNQVLFTADERLNKQKTLEIANILTLKFNEVGIDTSTMKFTIWDETLDRSFFNADAGSMDELGTIFGFIGFIISSIAIFNILTRTVQSQKKNIGLFMSMGATKRALIFHYAKITLILGIIGVVLGIPLGYLFSIGIVKVATLLYGFTHLVFPIDLWEYIMAIIVSLSICFIASILSVISITSTTPREAMSAFFNRIIVTKSTISEKIFGWIPVFRHLYMRVPIREIFLRKKKTTAIILTLMISMIMLINSVAMVGNMVIGVNNYYNKYNNADIQVKFQNALSVNELNQFMNNRNNQFEKYEFFLSIYSKLSVNGQFKGWVEIQCFQENSTMRNFNVIKGDVKYKSDLNQFNVLLGQSLAGKYDIKLGDKIQIGTLNNYTVSVSGLVGELVDYNILWTYEAYQKENISDYFGIPDNYINGLLLKTNGNTNLTKFREELNAAFPISQWMDSDTSKKSILVLMESMMGILSLLILISLFIGFLFSVSSMYMGFISRENDFLSFRAMGADNKYLKRMIFWENTLLSLFSLILTVPVGYFFYWASTNYMLGDRFYLPISIPFYTWILVFLLNLISIWFATRRVIKKINKMVLIEELRNRIIS